MSDEKLMFELIKEVRETLGDYKETQLIQSVDIAEMKSDLKYHIRRTDILEDLHKDNQRKIENSEKRIEELETPEKFKKYLFKIWGIWSSVIIAVLTAISKLAGMW